MADENPLAPGRGTRLEVDEPPVNQLFLGDPEAAAAVASSQAMAPIVGPYLKDVFTGQAAKRSFMEMFPPTPDWDPNKSAVENARNQLRGDISPTAMDLAMGFSGGGLHFRAYHGSRAKFGEFLDQYMSSGEGGQAFSWGHYVGQHPGTGESYQRSVGGYQKVPADPVTGEPLTGVDLARKVYEPDNILTDPHGYQHRVIKFNEPKSPASEWSVETAPVSINTDRTIERVKAGKGHELEAQYTGARYGDLWDTRGSSEVHSKDPGWYDIDKLAQARGWEMRDPGYFYDVWVKPEHHEFLDWFKKYSEQEPAVRDKLRPIMQQMGVDPFGPQPRMGPNPQDMTGREIYSLLTQHNAPFGQPGSTRTPTREEWQAAKKRASKQLDSVGIPGMRFWDEGSRHLPDFSMDFGGKIPQEISNSPLATWFSNQMQNAGSFRNLQLRVQKGYNEAYKRTEVLAATHGFPTKQMEADFMIKQLQPYEDLINFVAKNEKDFTSVPTKKTYNYVIYDPKNLEITHRDGRKLIPVDDDPIFPERTKAYKPR